MRHHVSHNYEWEGMPGHPFGHLLAMIKSEAVAVLPGLQSGQLHEKAGPKGWTMGSPKPSLFGDTGSFVNPVTPGRTGVLEPPTETKKSGWPP